MRIYNTPEIISSVSRGFIWGIPSESKDIYLTFDDGPTKVATRWILDTLKDFDAKATFFCVGENVSKHDELCRLILEEGHIIGNHTFNHLNGHKTKVDDYVENVVKCSEYIDSDLFRPPYGKIRPQQAKKLRNLGYKIIMWSILSYDFDDISPEVITEKCIKHSKPGCIIVFHDNEKSFGKLKKVLPGYLEYLSSGGYNFKSIAL